MSNLRLATEADIPEILLLAQEAHKESPHGLKFDPQQVEVSIRSIFQQGICICLMNNGQVVGLIAGIKTLTPMSLEPVAAELLWYVHPQHRTLSSLKLLDAFEYWAWSKGCSAVTIGNMTNDYSERTDKIYRRKGYKLVEQSYMKGLK